MDEQEWLAQRFEENRGHLRAVAFRMLGSVSEADDAIQEAWLRLSRSGAGEIENLAGWLTTVVARVCLDALRARKSRREESLNAQETEPVARGKGGTDPEHEAVLADSVGLALLVVLDRLTPAERLAFVLHDLFGVSFEDVGEVVGRSPAAARQLASRARRRVQGSPAVPKADLSSQRKIVDAFLTALRGGDFEGLVSVLDPDFEVRTDLAGTPTAPEEGRGAHFWARQALNFSRGARFTRPALVDGAVGALVAPRGRLSRVLRFTIVDGKITRMDVIGDPAHLRELDLAALPD